MEGWHFILQARTEEEGHQKTKIKAELYLIQGFHNISETDWHGIELYSKSSLSLAVMPWSMPWCPGIKLFPEEDGVTHQLCNTQSLS